MMKRAFILVAVALFVAGTVMAEEATLIDFTKLTADTAVYPENYQGDSSVNNQNEQTLMDFSTVAGNSYTAEQKQVMRTSLAIEQWDVTLASSSRTVTNQSLSFASPTKSTAYGEVMGVRVHFPLEPFNSWARITPPFEIPAYDWAPDGDRSQPSRFEQGFGVVKNVGVIKSLAVDVYGLNFPHRLGVILIDNAGNEKVIQLGSLRFDGWSTLTWNNPSYVTEVRNRDVRLYPLYPQSTPFVKFGGFVVSRDATNEGGDFVTYFRQVKIIYDKAVLDTERDIDDEGQWSIIQTREDARRATEVGRFGQVQVNRYLESQKRADPDADFTGMVNSPSEE